MDRSGFSRRSFLEQAVTGAGAAWLAAAWPQILSAQQHAQHAMRAVAAGAPAKLEALTPAQAADIEAITSLIIPTTDTPGAREAGVVYFVDHAVHTANDAQRKHFDDAMAGLEAKRKEMFSGSASFASLSVPQQTELLKAIEKTPDFVTFHFLTVCGFLGNPEDGANRDTVGWKAIGFDHASTHTPPFGYYDAEYLKEKSAARKGSKS